MCRAAEALRFLRIPPLSKGVTPTKVGAHLAGDAMPDCWVPAFAGMTP
jgi:hypothetical protein